MCILQSCSASVSPKSTGDRDHGSPNESSKVDACHQQCMHPPPTAVPHLTTVPPVAYPHTMFTGPDLHRFCRCRKHGVCMTSHSVIPCTMLVSSVQLLSLSIPESGLTTWGNLQVHLSTPCICWYICRCKPPKPSSTAAVRQTSSTNIVSKSCLRHEPGQSNKP